MISSFSVNQTVIDGTVTWTLHNKSQIPLNYLGVVVGDYNNYKTPGVYKIDFNVSGQIANSMTNHVNYGILVVSATIDAHVTQMVYETAGIHHIFSRSHWNAGGWGPWQQLAMTDDLSNYLPLSGGIMLGDGIRRNVDDSALAILGSTAWDKGGYIALYGNDFNGESAGEVRLGTHDSGNGIYALRIKNNKTMLIETESGYWDLGGSAIVAKSIAYNGYIKYASGLIIQWGVLLSSDTIVDVTLNLTMTVLGATALYDNSADFMGTDQSIAVQSEISNNRLRIQRNTGVSVYGIRWMAIGY